MNWSDELKEFIISHRTEDPLSLVLQQKKYPKWDMKFVAQQIEGYRMAQDKLPTLSLCDDFVYPPKLNREQCSSETTALFKAMEYAEGKHIADITGGLGIDTVFMAKYAATVDYIEQDEELHDIATHNFRALELGNISAHCSDSINFLKNTNKHFDLIYADPARRDNQGRKVSALENCTPNILENIDLLLSKADMLLIKSSPMLDITEAVAQLKHVSEITIVAVKNECKEILFLCTGSVSDTSPKCRCINFKSNGSVDKITFNREEETTLSIPYSANIEQYIYDPNVTLLKGGAFKTTSILYDIKKIHRNTHLYTSEKKIEQFAGRIFKVIKELHPSAKEIAKDIPNGKAHVITRNYPMSSEELQKKLRLKEGGDLYIIGLTKRDDKKAIYLCEAIAN
ncbi:MAG: class I SAM-dependent methyltransferase [Bacteroidales bacterium]|nr:class I SAM-dependent methyltransferase [Bacteroidales bacterium]